MLRGEETIGPIDRPASGQSTRVRQYDLRGEFVGFAAQPIGDPRSHYRKTIESKTGILFESGGCMVGRIGNHGADHRQLIGDFSQVRKQIGDPQAAIATLFEFPVVLTNQADLVEKRGGPFFGLKRLAVKPGKFWLVIEWPLSLPYAPDNIVFFATIHHVN